MNLTVSFYIFNIEVIEIFGADDNVVMEGYYQGINKATVKSSNANAIFFRKRVKMVQLILTYRPYLFQCSDL